MTEAIFFYTFSGVMLLGALSVVFNPRPIYAVLSLLVAMFSLACLFVMLGAYFVAALQVLLYAGAVLILFLFVIMLLNLAPRELARKRAFTVRGIGTLAPLLLALLLVRIFLHEAQPAVPLATGAPEGSVEAIGRVLFSTYLLPFELTSFLILAAIIGAVALGKQTTPRR